MRIAFLGVRGVPADYGGFGRSSSSSAGVSPSGGDDVTVGAG